MLVPCNVLYPESLYEVYGFGQSGDSYEVGGAGLEFVGELGICGLLEGY